MKIKERILEIKELADKASVGPWVDNIETQDPNIDANNGGMVARVQYHGNVRTIKETGETFSYSDARFIAASRTLVPQLCDALLKCVELTDFQLKGTPYEYELDCGDNSCEFAEQKDGMRTNAGCRCFRDNPEAVSRLASTLMQRRRRLFEEVTNLLEKK